MCHVASRRNNNGLTLKKRLGKSLYEKNPYNFLIVFNLLLKAAEFHI